MNARTIVVDLRFQRGNRGLVGRRGRGSTPSRRSPLMGIVRARQGKVQFLRAFEGLENKGMLFEMMLKAQALTLDASVRMTGLSVELFCFAK